MLEQRRKPFIVFPFCTTIPHLLVEVHHCTNQYALRFGSRCECIPHTLLRNGKQAKDGWRKSQAKVRERGGISNDVGRQELCASLVNKNNKNCEAVRLESGAKARDIDEGIDPDSVILQDTDRLFSVQWLWRMWLFCSQRSGCKGEQGALCYQNPLLSNSA